MKFSNHFINTVMRITIYLFLFFTATYLPAQQQWWNKLSLSFEYRDKVNLYTLAEASPPAISIKYPIRVHNFAFSLRYQLNKRVSVETGYWQELFVTGFRLPTYYDLSYRYIGEAGDMVPLRCNVDALRVSVFKRDLVLSSSLGAIVGFSKVRGKEPYITDFESPGTGRSFIIDASGTRLLDFDRSYTYGKEYGLAKVYVLFEGRVEAAYELFTATHLFGGLSYSLGTQTLGRVSVDYSENLGPFKNIAMATRGNSHAWFAGIRVDLKNFKQ
jgi:hypothetical protein